MTLSTLSTFGLINFMSDNLLANLSTVHEKGADGATPTDFGHVLLLHFVVSLAKASLKVLEMQIFVIGKVSTIWL
jgi:hypothetical protein